MRPIHTFALAVAAILLLARPALAQSPGMSIPLNSDEAKSPEEIEKQKQIESDYKATIKKMPSAKPDDPWGNMRSADTGTQSKPTQIKPKTAAPKKTTNAVN